MRIKTLIYFIVLIVLTSCSANKYLTDGDKYFEGHYVKILDDKSDLPKDLEFDLHEDFKPNTTRRYLMSRPGTWIYQVMGEPKKDKGIRHWIKYKLGAKPYYYSSLKLDRNISVIQSKLSRNGYFNSKITTEIDSSKNKAKAYYLIELNKPYFLDSIMICTDNEVVCAQMESYKKSDPVIEMGDLFRESRLVEARKNISRKFRNNGYYYFSPDLMYFQADSNNGSQTIKLKMELKNEIIPYSLVQYTLNSVTINLAVKSENTITLGDQLRVMVDTNHLYIKPLKLQPFIAFKTSELYNKSDEELTLKQLNRLEVFEFVNVQYKIDTTASIPTINAMLLATPKRKHSLRTEFNLSTTSTNFTGPGLQVEYYNRNLFRGAEKLRITATGRYETQLTGSRKGLDSYEIDLQTSLLIPRVSGPLKNMASGGNVPKTKYRVQFRLYDQPDYYAQASSSASFGYEWLKGNTTLNDLRLVNIDFVRLLRSSERLEELFDDNILSRESFADQVIFGSSYSFAHSQKSKKGRKVRYFFGASGEVSGNLLYAINKWSNAAKNEHGQYTFATVPFAQYVRLQADFRQYFKWIKFNELVFRQNVGVGIPYGNSSALPFSKQFFVGGASSLRAFLPRSIGPGTYVNEEQGDDSYFDQSGDILIELNFENRLNMGQYLEGAVFLDIGNVWLKNKSEARPGGEFLWNSFINQMAVAGGFGLRLNFDFVIVRVDLGIPFRIPYYPEGERWVVDKISIEKNWRHDNLLWNFAIGYPF